MLLSLTVSVQTVYDHPNFDVGGHLPQVANILKSVGVVDRDSVAIGCCKVLPSVTETALLACLHAELLHQPAFQTQTVSPFEDGQQSLCMLITDIHVLS